MVDGAGVVATYTSSLCCNITTSWWLEVVDVTLLTVANLWCFGRVSVSGFVVVKRVDTVQLLVKQQKRLRENGDEV